MWRRYWGWISMAGKPSLTSKKYTAIKIMLNAQTPVSEISEYMEVSESVVYRVKNTQDFEEYQQSRRTAAIFATNKSAAADPQQVEHIHHHEQSVTIIANHYMAEELRKQTELLTIISNKLAFIVDELCGTGQKKEENA